MEETGPRGGERPSNVRRWAWLTSKLPLMSKVAEAREPVELEIGG